MFSLEQRKLNLDSVAMLPSKSVISQKTEVHPQIGFEHTKVNW